MTDPWLPPDPARTRESGEVPYWVDDREFASGWRPPVAEPPEDQARRHATAFLGPALLMPLLGAPVALLWRAVTPPVGIARTDSGPVPTAGESDQFFAITGWFFVVTIVVGLVAGAAAWWFLRGRGAAGALGLTVGSLVASGVTAIVGSRLVLDSYLHDYCTDNGLACAIYDGTLRLDVPAAIVAWPVGALLTFAALTLLRERDPHQYPYTP